MSESHDPLVVEDATPESGGCPVVPGLTHPTQGDDSAASQLVGLHLLRVLPGRAAFRTCGFELQLKYPSDSIGGAFA